MIGFVNIVKYSIDSDVSDGFDIEQLILSKREDNLQFEKQGDPVNKFVYFNIESKEYSMIYLYDDESK